MKLVTAHCIHNDEQFINEVLYDDLKIRDLDAIHVYDGAWKHGGDTVISTDKTKEILEEFVKYLDSTNSRVEMLYSSPPAIFESEPAKRNEQLQTIERYFGDDDYYVFVKDGDEIIQFPNGLQSIWLKDYLKEKYPKTLCTWSYALDSELGMITPRLIPGKKNVHYDSSMSMRVHNDHCELLFDYNLENQRGLVGTVSRSEYMVKQFFIVNKWNKRNKERMLWKEEFYQSQVKAPGQCNYKKYEPVQLL